MDPTAVDLSLQMVDLFFRLLFAGPLEVVGGISPGNLKPGIAGHCSWCAAVREKRERLLQEVTQKAGKPVAIWKRRKGEEISFGRKQTLEEKAD